MEFVFYPSGFGVQAGKSPTIQGGQQDTMVVLIQDVSGNTAKIVFGLEDYKRFQEHAADPAGAAARAQARAKILGPGALSSTLKQRKH